MNNPQLITLISETIGTKKMVSLLRFEYAEYMELDEQQQEEFNVLPHITTDELESYTVHAVGNVDGVIMAFVYSESECSYSSMPLFEHVDNADLHHINAILENRTTGRKIADEIQGMTAGESGDYIESLNLESEMGEHSGAHIEPYLIFFQDGSGLLISLHDGFMWDDNNATCNYSALTAEQVKFLTTI